MLLVLLPVEVMMMHQRQTEKLRVTMKEKRLHLKMMSCRLQKTAKVDHLQIVKVKTYLKKEDCFMSFNKRLLASNEENFKKRARQMKKQKQKQLNKAQDGTRTFFGILTFILSRKKYYLQWSRILANSKRLELFKQL